MAGSQQGRSRRFSGIRARRHAHAQMSDINVTPMVDVMLVLLVVFMVAAPLLTVGVQVELPKTKAAAIQGQDEPLSISINKEGRIFLQETAVDLNALVPRLIAITGNNPDVRIFLRGDKDIPYGRVMRVMGVVNGAGFSKVALVTDRQSPKRKKK